MEHTPGTWEEHINELGQLFVVHREGEEIKRIICFIGDLEETEAIDHFDTHLITAAPDLLAACEIGTELLTGPQFLRFLADQMKGMGLRAWPDALRAKATAEEAAIKKAKNL